MGGDGYKGTDIQHAVQYLGRVCRKRTISFLISDFLSTDYLHQLKTASKKHEFIAVLLSDPGDFILPEAGILSVEDLETGEILRFDASDPNTRHLFEANKRHEHNKTLEILKGTDIDCIDMNTESDVVDTLTQYFRVREKRKR